MTSYQIRYVSDSVIDGRDFVLCSRHTDGVTLYMRCGIRDLPDVENAEVWERAWAAFRELAHVGEIVPEPVRRRLVVAAH